MGKCEYILAKSGNTFEVLQKNEPCGSNGNVSCIRKITVKVKGLDVRFARDSFVVVDGKPRGLPYKNKGKRHTIIL